MSEACKHVGKPRCADDRTSTVGKPWCAINHVHMHKHVWCFVNRCCRSRFAATADRGVPEAAAASRRLLSRPSPQASGASRAETVVGDVHGASTSTQRTLENN